MGGLGGAPEPQAKPKPRSPVHYLWAALIGRIYAVFPLTCAHCAGPLRIIGFITCSADIARLLEHIGVDAEASRITPARGPPLWHDCAAQEPGAGALGEPDGNMANQSPPTTPKIRRIGISTACGQVWHRKAASRVVLSLMWRSEFPRFCRPSAQTTWRAGLRAQPCPGAVVAFQVQQVHQSVR